jgi:hypothetical protein
MLDGAHAIVAITLAFAVVGLEYGGLGLLVGVIAGVTSLDRHPPYDRHHRPSS